mmetsp:Transcript_27592/g.89879  ORF Transcript_27592/g.89879 Transcript_27592/m.89879 type:complete len:225 (+) Transcript_27592:1743-2417(+)
MFSTAIQTSPSFTPVQTSSTSSPSWYALTSKEATSHPNILLVSSSILRCSRSLMLSRATSSGTKLCIIQAASTCPRLTASSMAEVPEASRRAGGQSFSSSSILAMLLWPSITARWRRENPSLSSFCARSFPCGCEQRLDSTRGMPLLHASCRGNSPSLVGRSTPEKEPASSMSSTTSSLPERMAHVIGVILKSSCCFIMMPHATLAGFRSSSIRAASLWPCMHA